MSAPRQTSRRTTRDRLRRAVPFLLLFTLPALGQGARREAQQVQPPDASREQGERRFEALQPPAPETTTARVAGRLTVPASRAAGSDAEPLAGATLLVLEPQAARIRLADGEHLLRPGASVGGDTVQSVAGRQIVLRRPAAPGDPRGEGLVVVRFDAAGRARVRVFRERHGLTPPPEVR